jgi:hypothetical protein
MRYLIITATLLLFACSSQKAEHFDYVGPFVEVSPQNTFNILNADSTGVTKYIAGSDTITVFVSHVGPNDFPFIKTNADYILTCYPENVRSNTPHIVPSFEGVVWVRYANKNTLFITN